MRTIKFRAWDGFRMSAAFGIGVMPEAFYKNNQPDLTFMQFTGLKDKNNKEIYEGDVIQDNIGRRVVEIGFGSFTDPDGFEHEFYGVYGRWVGEEDSKSYFNKNDKDLEIIGNIYENPELLK